jgi:eukaryotic-like serine/threonine-protein kinase
MSPDSQPDLFGDVAVEMGVLSPAQLVTVHDHLRKTSPGTGAAQAALDLKLLTVDQVAQVNHEKQRRSLASQRKVGPFEIIEKIGAGGMGAVYRARDTRKGRVVALKILPPALAKDGRYLERFTREAEIASKLDHENIVKGYGAEQADGLHFFSMEYVDGDNVQQMLGKVERFPEGTALQIMLPIARGLQHAHYNGLVHQDIKPENIIIDRKGIAKLLDLGLARRPRDVATVRLGTPLYVPPEQVTGTTQVDIRSDIYSLGATLFHMLTGRPPYVGKDERDTMSRHLEEELPWPQDFVPELSDGICQVVARMLAKDPAERYQNPKELIYDFEALLDERDPVYAVGGGAKPRAPHKPPSASRIRRAGPARSRRAQPPAKKTDAMTMYLVIVIGIVVVLGALVAILAGG